MRKEKYELPTDAIREMIINAHCHRNFLEESCIQVAIYDDRLEVTSPGGLYNGLTYEEIMNGHSKIRNRGLANIFSQMGLVELFRKGDLVDKSIGEGWSTIGNNNETIGEKWEIIGDRGKSIGEEVKYKNQIRENGQYCN